MSRESIVREWTKKDRDDATKIVDFIAAYQGDLIGAWHIARMLGYNNPRTTGRQKVYVIMPLASMLCRDMYPGRTLATVHDDGGNLYQITTDVVATTKTVTPRLHSVSTKILRLEAEIEALRTDVGSLRSSYLVTVIDQMAGLVKSIAPTMDRITALEQAEAKVEVQ